MNGESTSTESTGEGPAAGDAAESGSSEITIGDISGSGIAIGNIASVVASPEGTAFATAVTIYSKAFLEALGKRTGESVADLSKRVGGLVRARIRKRGEPARVAIGLAEKASAVFLIGEDTPDEARLALLDLDVTAPELRGKGLRWDGDAQVWKPLDGPGQAQIGQERAPGAPGSTSFPFTRRARCAVPRRSRGWSSTGIHGGQIRPGQ